MPLIGRGDMVDNLVCDHGEPDTDLPCLCCVEMLVPTQMCAALGGSLDVFVEGFGAARLNDFMMMHPDPLATPVPCAPHAPACNLASTTVFVNGLGVAREGDTYNSDAHMDHKLDTPSQSTVFADG